MKKNYDPELRKAMAEIEAVLKKYDCGGFICLQSLTHVEFKFALDTPSWSVLEYKGDDRANLKLHMKSNPINTEATVAMLANLQDIGSLVFNTGHSFLSQISKVAKVERTPFGGGITNEDR